MSLAELFPAEDYHFSMRLKRGDPSAFFAPFPDSERLLGERKHWLTTDPGAYSTLLPEGQPLLEEAIAAAGLWNSVPESALMDSAFSALEPASRCRALGGNWEPDFLLLKSEPSGSIRLLGGCVCFPSSWALEEKIGHPIEFIHGVVPGLNDSVGASIQTFLKKLRPGIAWLRENWGLSASNELNQHPKRRLSRLDSTATLETTWLRVEYQALIALPKSEGILFGIRLQSHRLDEVTKDPRVAQGLYRGLQTMPPAMAAYKGLATARDILVNLLAERIGL